MISISHVSLMARYNRWQNGSLFTAADNLTEKQRRENRGAFFGSLHTTLAHVLWADRVWMNRFADTPATSPFDDQGRGPDYQDWEKLRADRLAFDEAIFHWAGNNLTEGWLRAGLAWTNSTGTHTKIQPAWMQVTHFFNHQTHHRGQAHALLTSFGITTEDTDLFLMQSDAQ